MSAKPSAIPPKPKIAATKAMIRKITIKRIIILITVGVEPRQKIINTLTAELLRNLKI
mgnify:CR=1 FL=1